jgi:hypothetical protein
MTDKQKKLIGASLLIVILAVGLWLFTRKPKDDCDYSETLTFGDNMLAPALLPTDDLTWYPNYYQCHPVQKGDFVLYELGNPPEKYVRVAVAVGDDEVALYGDKAKRGWNITVNGEMVMMAGTPFFFGVQNVNPVINLFL